MPPIQSVATTFAFSPVVPSVALDPDSAGQSAAVTSQHLLGTGGFLFVAVALVSLAGYFYHARGAANGARSSNTWASLAGLFSSICQRSSATTSTPTAAEWHVDLEADFASHVSMVYARHFHPTSWNLVECHPATPSAPSIYVEEEASNTQVADPPPPGMNSFLDMDDDLAEASAKHTHKKQNQRELPPFDTSSPTSIKFSSEVIGTTIRPDAFLSVPGDPEDSLSEDLPCDSELDFPCLSYEGITTTDSESDLSYSQYDGVVTTLPGSSFGTRRYGVADMAYFSQSLRDAIPEDGYTLVSTILPPSGLRDLLSFVETDLISRSGFGERLGPVDNRPPSSTQGHGAADRVHLSDFLTDTIPEEDDDLVPSISSLTSLHDLSSFVETDKTLSCAPLYRLGPVDNGPTTFNANINVDHIRDSLCEYSSNGHTVGASHEGLDLMRKLLAELRDPAMDCTPRSLSEDSDTEYYDDDEKTEASDPHLTSTWFGHNAQRNSPKSTSSMRTDSDVSDEGPIYPLTPPSKSAVSLADATNVHKDPMSSLVVAGFNMSPLSMDSPLVLPTKAYVCSYRDSRSLYGPRAPVARLPRL